MADVEVEIDPDGIALVTLNRPEKMNAIRQSMWREIADVFAALSQDGAVRVIVLTGAGGHFSAGADISEFDVVRKDRETGEIYNRDVKRAVEAIAGAPKPVIAAICGNAIGGGLEVALACDFRIADANARGGITAAKRGIVYGIDPCRMLVDVVGKTMAKHILFTGALVHAEDGFRIGLFDQLADGDAVEAAKAYGRKMTLAAPMSVRGAKLAIDAIAAGRVDEVAAEHADLSATALDSADYREATAAFREKRQPVFVGA